jgi:predicted pyridoxine 5'-phosphate oxidase superfamily flavin-nucleotide-binding protein
LGGCTKTVRKWVARFEAEGDQAGLVQVIETKTPAIPDRLGDRRIDSFDDLLVNPEMGMVFPIPGFRFTLRVSGKGGIVRDTALQDRLDVTGKPPDLVPAVTVEEASLHRAKSMARSSIRQPDDRPDTTDLPSLAEAMVAHGKLADAIGQIQPLIENDFDTRTT